MKQYLNVITAYSIMVTLIILVGIFQSWNIALSILNYCLISAVMTMGANIQWGYAGLINFGIMGYTALGGLAVVLVFDFSYFFKTYLTANTIPIIRNRLNKIFEPPALQAS